MVLTTILSVSPLVPSKPQQGLGEPPLRTDSQTHTHGHYPSLPYPQGRGQGQTGQTGIQSQYEWLANNPDPYNPHNLALSQLYYQDNSPNIYGNNQSPDPRTQAWSGIYLQGPTIESISQTTLQDPRAQIPEVYISSGGTGSGFTRSRFGRGQGLSRFRIG